MMAPPVSLSTAVGEISSNAHPLDLLVSSSSHCCCQRSSSTTSVTSSAAAAAAATVSRRRITLGKELLGIAMEEALRNV